VPLPRVRGFGDAVNAAAGSLEPLLRVSGLQVDYGRRTALRDVSFDLFAGETVGVVGESGSGKSTLARAILRLIRASRGSVRWCGEELLACDPTVLRRLRRDLQIVFQDPLASLNPRMTVGEIIAEPLRIFERQWTAQARVEAVRAMLDQVGLSGDMVSRYPHEFSGGQCQRIAIARAMILKPKLLICDEPVSSLDVSIQGQIINLLLDLQRDTGSALLFISHNLAVVRHLSHRILVMYSGRLVEVAERDSLFSAAVHPYTRELLASVPSLDAAGGTRPAARATLGLAQEFAGATPPGCAFRHRCSYALPVCATSAPPFAEVAAGHGVACHRAAELAISGAHSAILPS
jgi:oligopeptide transport system ATP-binding protein